LFFRSGYFRGCGDWCKYNRW